MQRLDVEDNREQRVNRWALFVCSVVTAVITFSAFAIFTQTWKHGGLRPPNPEIPQPPSPSLLEKYSKAGVCTDATQCSRIARDVLKQNGSAVDAAIAALFCNGVINSQAMGLGGGFLMTIYIKEENKAYSLNAREVAPAKANKDMFEKNPDSSKTGGLAIGVPGELRGYWTAWKKFGKLPWSELVMPTVNLCDSGYNLTKPQYDVLDYRSNLIKNDPLLSEMYIDPKTGNFKHYGELIKPLKICDTLRIIAKEGGDTLHNGSLTDIFVEDIAQRGGIITKEDLQNYRATFMEPVSVILRNGIKVYSIPPPGSGPLLNYILKVLDGYNMNVNNFKKVGNAVLSIHRIVETFKFAFAKRTELADPIFVNTTNIVQKLISSEYAEATRLKINDQQTYANPDHYGAIYYQNDAHGTAHISVLSKEGDAVSVTSTVNIYFGAGVTSKRTGIILNSVMDDFSNPGYSNLFGLPPSPNNFIMPGKRPLSSACPTIIVNSSGDVELVIGASGGTKITTAVAWVIMRYLWLGENIKQAVDASRIHHQLMPMVISYEYGILDQIVKGLERLGHKTERYRERGSVVCAVSKIRDIIYANADFRRSGDVSGYD